MIASWNMSGIYKITNTINKKSYIGRTTNFLKRFEGHQKDLENNKHHNLELQTEYNIYGDTNFKFDIIEILDDFSNSREMESFHIREHAVSGTYNISNPLNEWNRFIDSNTHETIYDKLEEHKKFSLIQYENFEKEIRKEFDISFEKIANVLYSTGDVVYYDQLITEIHTRLDKENSHSLFLPLAIKKILDDKGIYTIYTTKHKRAFNKAGIQIENNTYIHISRRKFLEVYDVFRNREAKKNQPKNIVQEAKVVDINKEKKKERKKVKDRYIEEVRIKMARSTFNFEDMFANNVKKKGFMSFLDLINSLEEHNLLYTNMISEEERNDALKRYFRKIYNVSIFSWRNYKELLYLINIETNIIPEEETSIITGREEFLCVSKAYNKNLTS